MERTKIADGGGKEENRLKELHFKGKNRITVRASQDIKQETSIKE